MIAENSKSRTILISGAGIGGLTSALTLAQCGFRADVFEQAPSPSEVGAGIQISPNASRVLIALGLGDKLKQLAVVPTHLKIFNARRGRELTSIPLAKLAEERYGAPYYVIHRSDLQNLLLDAANKSPDIDVRFDHQINEIATHERGVTIQAHDNKEFTGQALIGADGLRSYVRQRIIGDGEPIFSGYIAWRGMIPVEKAPAEFQKPFTGLWLSKKAHIVHYPVRGGKMINVVVILRDGTPQMGWANHGEREMLLSRLSSLAAPIRSLAENVESWLTWALFDRPPSTSIVGGKVVLLGDAAHPMLPFLAQGGAMAIEDAAAIAKACRRCDGDFASAMLSYEKQRKARTARVQKTAQQNGKIYHASGLVAYFRNLKLRTTAPEKLLARFDWLYADHPH